MWGGTMSGTGQNSGLAMGRAGARTYRGAVRRVKRQGSSANQTVYRYSIGVDFVRMTAYMFVMVLELA